MGDDDRRIFTDLRTRARVRLAWTLAALVLLGLIAFHVYGACP